MRDRYNTFYNKYKDKLFSYLVYLSGDTDASKDIMQESFTRHYQHYRNDAAVSPALLFTIARNALVDHHRFQNRFKDVADFDEPSTVDEEKAIIVKEECKRVRKSLKQLSSTDQEILSMAVNGIPYREIASVVGASEASVKVRIHRARIKLRQMLSEEEAP